MKFFVMLDHEQSAALCDSIESARSMARRIRDRELECIVRTASIYTEDEQWIEDVPTHGSASGILKK
jgi:hypothetical protein